MTFIHIWVIKSNMYSKAVILIRNAMLVSFWSLKFYKMLTRDVTQLLAIWKIYPFFLVPQKCTQWNYIANDDDSLKRHLWNTHWRKATPLSAMRVYLNIETTSSNLRKHMMRKHVGEQPHSCKQYNYTSTFSDALQIHIMTHTGEKPLCIT